VLHEYPDPRIIEPLAKLVTNDSEDSTARANAACALANIRDPRVIAPLLTALRAKGYSGKDTREAVAISLYMTDSAEAVMPLVEALDDEASKVQKAAALSLGAMGDDRAIQPLLAHATATDNEVRAEVIRALAKLNPADHADVFARALEDKAAEVRVTALIGFQKIGTPEALTRIAGMLEDSAPAVVSAAARILRSADAAWSQTPAAQRTRDRMIEKAKKAYGSEAKDAVAALASIGDDASLAALISIVRERDNDELRAACAAAVGAIGGKKALKALIEWAGAKELSLRCAAIAAISEVGDAAAVPILKRALKSRWLQESSQAALALMKIGGPKVMSTFKGVVNDHRPRLRTIARIVLQARAS
jgi:HEAT repeat protein